MVSAPLSADIGSFQQHGSAFWDVQGPYRTLHQINPARLQFVERFVVLSGLRVLDVGCGGGILSEALAERGASVLGIDLAESALQAAEAHRAGQAVEYRLESSRETAARGEVFDVVTCMEMLEHVADPAAVLRDIHALLKPGGWAFFSTINRTFKARLGAVYAAEYLLHLVPQGTHQYDWFIKPAELSRMAERAGLTPVAFCGMDYLPLRQSACLSRNLDINYLFAARREAA
ncbi:3-demethylubiquinone-9 3-methyltransferase [Cardiobacterium hominis]|uniref:Ubiquinone biosynthesis O-methyltransferase n=1 Tax=Cardiobacterium hominis (strain ATCC 15826 / DSM 8339 / NCTC 10426 / 6573) TaxID=638300 RepID=C8N7Z7_CARH6|nr:bifunctional 2-polyprenyl-6-hydroxyphenol methylase/3-demethylubiquinol 3-O-methyltransferase UbiG [Cardiobacterium hominis]EEV89295.1 3-demethylubiquinone-9 3-O-methyltransferase [Cardiobacterium hominis ATCC 15826]VEG77234.1 3-demethylubiquinone-9 3-methyltransferase [Cardiobacterium hominis]